MKARKILLYSLVSMGIMNIAGDTTHRQAYNNSIIGAYRNGGYLRKVGLDYGVYNPTQATSTSGIIVDTEVTAATTQYINITSQTNIPASLIGYIALGKSTDEIMNLIKLWQNGTSNALFTFTSTAPTTDGLYIKITTSGTGVDRKLSKFESVYEKKGSTLYEFNANNTYMLPSYLVSTDDLTQQKTFFANTKYAENLFSAAKLKPIADDQNLYTAAGFVILDPASTSFVGSNSAYKVIGTLPVPLLNGTTSQTTYTYSPMWLSNKLGYVGATATDLLSDISWMNSGAGSAANDMPHYTLKMWHNTGSFKEQVPLGTGSSWSSLHPLGTYDLELSTYADIADANTYTAIDPANTLQGLFDNKFNPILNQVSGKILRFGDSIATETFTGSGQFNVNGLTLKGLIDRTSADKFVFDPANFASLALLQKGKTVGSDLVQSATTSTSWKATDFVASGSEFMISRGEKTALPLEIVSAIIAKQPQRRIDDMLNVWLNTLPVKKFIPATGNVTYTGTVTTAALYDTARNRVINTNGSAGSAVVNWVGTAEPRVYGDISDWYVKVGGSALAVSSADPVTTVTFTAGATTPFFLREGDFIDTDTNDLVLGSALTTGVNNALPEGARISLSTLPNEVSLYAFVANTRGSIEVPHSNIKLIIQDAVGFGTTSLSPSALNSSTIPYFSLKMNGNSFDSVKFNAYRKANQGGNVSTTLTPANTFLYRIGTDAKNSTASIYDLPTTTLINNSSTTVEKNLNNHPNWSILSNYGGLTVDLGTNDTVPYPSRGTNPGQYWGWGSQLLTRKPAVDFYDRITKACGTVPTLSKSATLDPTDVWKYFSFSIVNGATNLRSAATALGASADWTVKITYYADKASVPAPSATVCVGEMDPTMPHFYLQNGTRYSIAHPMQDVAVNSTSSTFNLNSIAPFRSGWSHKLVNKTGALTYLADNTYSPFMRYLDSGIKLYNDHNPALAATNPRLFNI